jgi:hypothetical protein
MRWTPLTLAAVNTFTETRYSYIFVKVSTITEGTGSTRVKINAQLSQQVWT